MKYLLKNLTFSYIALFFTQQLIGGFEFGLNSFYLLVLGLGLLAFLVKPVFKTLSLPEKGIMHIFLLFLLNFAVIYLLTAFVPYFGFRSTTPMLIFPGFMLPSKHLSPLNAAIVSVAVFSVIFGYFDWLSRCKK